MKQVRKVRNRKKMADHDRVYEVRKASSGSMNRSPMKNSENALIEKINEFTWRNRQEQKELVKREVNNGKKSLYYGFNEDGFQEKVFDNKKEAMEWLESKNFNI